MGQVHTIYIYRYWMVSTSLHYL